MVLESADQEVSAGNLGIKVASSSVSTGADLGDAIRSLRTHLIFLGGYLPSSIPVPI